MNLCFSQRLSNFMYKNMVVTNNMFVCGVSLTSGQLVRALSRLPQDDMLITLVL